jgi:hypothetical protein
MMKIIILVAVSIITAGCAKTNISHIHEESSIILSKPTRILIQDFSLASDSVQTGTGVFAKIKSVVTDESAESAKQELSSEVIEALNEELVAKVIALGFIANRAERNQQPAQNEIVITGKFLKIDEGNATKRNLIGLGAGQSSLDADVAVFAGTHAGVKEILNFSAHADSGNMPGAAVMGPAGAAAGATTAVTVATNVTKGAASAYKSNSANQASAVADKISEELSKYFQEQGWIKNGS